MTEQTTIFEKNISCPMIYLAQNKNYMPFEEIFTIFKTVYLTIFN